MKYYSIHNKSHRVSLKEAIFRGLAPDKGLYMPERIAKLEDSFLKEISRFTQEEIALQVSISLFGDDVDRRELEKITLDAINFPVPLVPVHNNIYSLELFHGPTLAFKDVGARFMARLLEYFTRDVKSEIHVLVATSGDTGSAVANGFLGVNGIKVHILYPKGLVSKLQEKQFTTLNENITALEVDGTFDDCQKLVKEAFTDSDLNNVIHLTSANSINLARLLPQTIYYFFAVSQLGVNPPEPVICVPSGNFGNITSGLIGKQMGLKVKKFIASTNINDIVPDYLRTGLYKPKPSIRTIANAMDVGDPSNFARIIELYGNSLEAIREDMEGFSYTDKQLSNAIRNVFTKYKYLTDPHGAAGYLGLCDYRKNNVMETGIFLETAHPSKFQEIVETITGEHLEIPERLRKFIDLEKKSIPMSREYKHFREYLRSLG